jgi:hypothetical protein
VTRTTNARIAGAAFVSYIAVGVAGMIVSGAATRSARRRTLNARIAHTLTKWSSGFPVSGGAREPVHQLRRTW